MRISSPEAMHQYGFSLAKKSKVLLLDGELGAGKTTLIKGFAEALGIDPASVQSPTYAYIHSYDDLLLHIDMYRLSRFEELIEKGILDQITEYERIVIERPKRKDQLDLEGALHLKISKCSAGERDVTVLE